MIDDFFLIIMRMETRNCKSNRNHRGYDIPKTIWSSFHKFKGETIQINTYKKNINIHSEKLTH